MDINPLDCPKANSTFVVDKKLLGNKDDLSPDIFPIDNDTYIKPNNATYMLAKNASKNLDININLIPVESSKVKDSRVTSVKKANKKERYF